MSNSGKKFRTLRDKKNKYSNSRVVQKTITPPPPPPPPPPFKLNGRSLKHIKISAHVPGLVHAFCDLLQNPL